MSDRIGPALGVAVVHLLFAYALVSGLKVGASGNRVEGPPLAVLDLKPPRAEQPETPPPQRPPPPARPGGGASPPAAKAVAPAPAPPMEIPALSIPPPVIDVPTVPAGGGAVSGAAGRAGGTGSGTGEGSGSGGGHDQGIGQGGEFTSARQVRGRFRNSDFPASARRAGRLRIGVRYAVGPTGRIDRCEIIEPSGYPEVDAMTCRVIIERYRFKPARDEQGIPVTEVLEEDYSWRLD